MQREEARRPASARPARSSGCSRSTRRTWSPARPAPALPGRRRPSLSWPRPARALWPRWLRRRREGVAAQARPAQLCEGLLKPEGATPRPPPLAEIDPLDRDAATPSTASTRELERPQDLAYALELRRAQEGQSPQGRELGFRLAELKRSEARTTAGALQLSGRSSPPTPRTRAPATALEAWVERLRPRARRAGAARPGAEQGRRSRAPLALREARLGWRLREEQEPALARDPRDLRERPGPARARLHRRLQAFAQDIDREALVPELERLAPRDQRLRGAGRGLRGGGLSHRGRGQVAPRYSRRAAELREQLSQAEGASSSGRSCWRCAPAIREALDSLSALYEKSQNAQNLAEVYRQKAQLATDPARSVACCCKAAHAPDGGGPARRRPREAPRGARNLQALAALDASTRGLKLSAREHADVLAPLAEPTQGPERTGEPAQRARCSRRRATSRGGGRLRGPLAESLGRIAPRSPASSGCSSRSRCGECRAQLEPPTAA